jgi:hypothetical protein
MSFLSPTLTSTSYLILLYYLGGGREFFTVISKRFPPLVLYSFVFIVSGFVTQSLYQPVIDFLYHPKKKSQINSNLLLLL